MQKTILAATGALVLVIAVAGLACNGGDGGGSDTGVSDAPAEPSDVDGGIDAGGGDAGGGDAGGGDAGGGDPGGSDPGGSDPEGGFAGGNDPEEGFAGGSDAGGSPSQLCIGLDGLDAVLADLEEFADDEELVAILLLDLEGAFAEVDISYGEREFTDESMERLESAYFRFQDAIQGRVTTEVGDTAAPIDDMQASVAALKTANC